MMTSRWLAGCSRCHSRSARVMTSGSGATGVPRDLGRREATALGVRNVRLGDELKCVGVLHVGRAGQLEGHPQRSALVTVLVVDVRVHG